MWLTNQEKQGVKKRGELDLIYVSFVTMNGDGYRWVHRDTRDPATHEELMEYKGR